MADLNCLSLKYFTICKTLGDWEVATCTRSVEISVHVGLFDNKKKMVGESVEKGQDWTFSLWEKDENIQKFMTNA